MKVAVDTSGPALAESLAAGPTLIKPNRDELAEAIDGPINSFADAAAAAESLRDEGAGAVLASLGGDGAILADGVMCAAACAVPDRRSTVGAGDCLLAGFLAAGASGEQALLSAVQWAAASVALPGKRRAHERADCAPAPRPHHRFRWQGTVDIDVRKSPAIRYRLRRRRRPIQQKGS